MAGSKTLEQWPQAGRWPESFNHLWTGLMKRHGKQSGTRQMIDVLKLDRQHGYGRLREAVELTLQSGSHDVCAIRYLLSATQRSATQLPVMELGLLGRYEGCVAIVLGPV